MIINNVLIVIMIVIITYGGKDMQMLRVPKL